MTHKDCLKELATNLVGEFVEKGFWYNQAVKTISANIDKLSEQRAKEILIWLHENTVV